MTTETIIFIRPIVVVSQTFTDGVSMFETASQHRAWGIFVAGPDTNVAGTAPTRQSAIDAATEMSSQHGWVIGQIAPEPEAEGKPEGETLQ